MVYVMIYKGLYQLKLANDQQAIRSWLQDKFQSSNTKAPAQTKVREPSEHQYFETFKQLIEAQHLYHNPDLSRDEVAQMIGISGGYLSQILNRITGKSFPELINDYRVASAKEMILNPEFAHYSLVAIGLEAGFKSKSNFYTSFKRMVGTTPGVFKKQQFGT